MWSTYTTHAVSGRWEHAVHPRMLLRWCELLDRLWEKENPAMNEVQILQKGVVVARTSIQGEDKETVIMDLREELRAAENADSDWLDGLDDDS